jgi:geranylgeranyl transferase type-2 subunit alpha
LALTSKVLRANPEYYTAWNARRRSLTSGSLSRLSAGSWRSRASPSSSATGTHILSSDGSSTSSSTTTLPGRDRLTTGGSGIIAERRQEDGAETIASNDNDGISNEEEKRVREQEVDQDLNVLRSELSFTIPLLLESPKCYWIWNYRLWTLQQAIERLPVPIARKVWEEELGLASKMLTKDRRNFHAWGYRRKLVAQLESPELEGKSMVESEFEYTTKMIHVDLSNFSAWHNRSRLIPRLLEERGAGDETRKKFLDDGMIVLSLPLIQLAVFFRDLLLICSSKN